MKIFQNISLLKNLYHSGWKYNTPSNLNFFWNFGSLILIIFIFQLISGILLAMHYIPHVDYAFLSVEHIMRDVSYGWFIRYWHANGASFFFFFVYLHIARGLFYSSYSSPRELLWIIGVIIFLIMIITAFLGYVLPWGQMSYWAATVITSLVSTIPSIGEEILKWLWGGFSVTTVTLNRFFSLHYTLSFIIFGLIFLHILVLHEHGSNNPLGFSYNKDGKVGKIFFGPFFLIKDLHGIFVIFYFILLFIFFVPDKLGHPDNYIPANPQVTPAHIVPEWYFLPFYAILRSVPNKLLGVILLLASILVLIFLPFFSQPLVRSIKFKDYSLIFIFIFFFNFIILFWVGGKPLEEPYLYLSRISTIFYFFYFLYLIPLLAYLEEDFLFLIKNLGKNFVYDLPEVALFFNVPRIENRKMYYRSNFYYKNHRRSRILNYYKSLNDYHKKSYNDQWGIESLLNRGSELKDYWNHLYKGFIENKIFNFKYGKKKINNNIKKIFKK
jgi:ubiquinol-cytochrome c reductase cytochrome b subunit